MHSSGLRSINARNSIIKKLAMEPVKIEIKQNRARKKYFLLGSYQPLFNAAEEKLQLFGRTWRRRMCDTPIAIRLIVGETVSKKNDHNEKKIRLRNSPYEARKIIIIIIIATTITSDSSKSTTLLNTLSQSWSLDKLPRTTYINQSTKQPNNQTTMDQLTHSSPNGPHGLKANFLNLRVSLHHSHTKLNQPQG